MNPTALRRLVGDHLINRVINEENLAIEIVAKNPAHLMGVVQQMHKADTERDRRRIFDRLSRDEQLAFTFLAYDPNASEKVRDYLHRNA